MAAKKAAQKFSAEERAAMRERAKELKGQADGESAIQEKIAEMPKADRVMAKKVHALVKANAPDLMPRTWYGMPAYADKDGNVVCFFQNASKFKARYATLGFNDRANLDKGNMWPVAFALKGISAAEEKKIAALLKKAAR
jgi:uncharacterized protein YdhG (YjbR/CyaY superfamily)